MKIFPVIQKIFCLKYSCIHTLLKLNSIWWLKLLYNAGTKKKYKPIAKQQLPWLLADMIQATTFCHNEHVNDNFDQQDAVYPVGKNQLFLTH